MAEGEEFRKKPFQFSTPRRERIYSRLRKVGPVGVFFKDACRLMNEEPLYESTTHLVAHLLREIEGGLRQVLVSASSQPGPKGREGHQSSVNAILAALEFSRESSCRRDLDTFRDRKRLPDLRDAHTATNISSASTG